MSEQIITALVETRKLISRPLPFIQIALCEAESATLGYDAAHLDRQEHILRSYLHFVDTMTEGLEGVDFLTPRASFALEQERIRVERLLRTVQGRRSSQQS